MCCNACIFGGDLDSNSQHYNKYRLISRSKWFEGFYCALILCCVVIAIVLLTDEKLNCSPSHIHWFLFAHLIKSCVCAAIFAFIPKSCTILRYSPMIFMDIPCSIIVIVSIWISSLSGDCLDTISHNSMLLFTTVSIFMIHVIFPLMAMFRFAEIMEFSYRIKECKQQRQRDRVYNPKNHSFEQEQKGNEEVELQISMANQNDCLEESETDEFAVVQQVFSMFSQQLQLQVPNAHKRNPTSLSNIFNAATRFITSGIINTFEIDDICIICYDNYVKGGYLSNLKCGHAFHRQCIKEWLETEEQTCPLCRADVSEPFA